jgi:hypothetical protein
MIKNRLRFFIPTLAFAAASTGFAAPTTSIPLDTSGVGPVKIHWGHIERSGNNVDLSQGVTVKSSEYSFAAESMSGVLWTGKPKGAYILDHAVAKGDPKKRTQVKVETQSLTQGYDTIIWADTATYACDSTFVTDGTLTFTGHVKMETHDNAALAEPGITTFGKLTVTLGKGKDYPKIEGDEGDATFVPNQGSK